MMDVRNAIRTHFNFDEELLSGIEFVTTQVTSNDVTRQIRPPLAPDRVASGSNPEHSKEPPRTPKTKFLVFEFSL